MAGMGKIALAAVLASGMIAATVVVAARKMETPHGVIVVPHGQDVDPASLDRLRCRTLTIPERDCEAAWEARRRHFFGKDERP